MLFLNFKIPSLKRCVLVFAVVTVAVVLLFCCFKGSYQRAETTVHIDEDFSPAAYISSFGPEVDISKLRVDEVTVPQEFGDVYTSYNNIQKSQGFDLEKYKGKTLIRYTYPVTNYPDGSKFVFAEVLVFEGVIVAADIYSTESGGFISALK